MEELPGNYGGVAMPKVEGEGWSAGASYEDFMGRWSRLVAAKFVEWVESEPGGHWLDVGTGTGALAAAICSLAQPRSVVACDTSEPFIETARQRLTDPRVTFEVSGVGNLPMRQGGYDAVVSGLALNFFPDLDLAVREQLSAAASVGRVGAYVWDYAQGMEFLRYFWDPAVVVEPAAAELDEGRRFPICRPQALFADSGQRSHRSAGPRLGGRGLQALIETKGTHD